MRKILRKIGDSTGVIFNKEERLIHDLKKDDIVEIIVNKVRQR